MLKGAAGASDQSQLNWIANFIWGIADDVLRDVYVRGKYRDVILPMTVIRRLDSVLEATKPAVLELNQTSGFCQRTSLKRAKSVSADSTTRPCSMARAASWASGTRLPVT